MKIRMHLGGYDESMATTEDIEPTVEEISRYVTAALGEAVVTGVSVTSKIDPRNGWNTRHVLGVIKDQPSVLAMIDAIEWPVSKRPGKSGISYEQYVPLQMSLSEEEWQRKKDKTMEKFYRTSNALTDAHKRVGSGSTKGDEK